MKFKIRFAEQLVGLFVIIAVLFVTFLIILMGINQKWFEKKYYFRSRFSSGYNIKIGTPITLKGFTIGKVTRTGLNNDNEVDIVFYIFHKHFKRIKKYSIIEQISNPLGGGGLVFHPGNSGEPLLSIEAYEREYVDNKKRPFIPSMDIVEGRQLIEKGLVIIPTRDDTINRLISDVDKTLNDLDTAILSINTILKGDDENKIVPTINRILQDIETVTSEFKNGEGLLKTLVGSKGSLSRILDDDYVLFNKINKSLSDFSDSVNNLRNITEYVYDITPEISNFIDQGNDVLEGLKNNPLLKGGITQEREQQTTFESIRDEDF